MSHAPTPHVVYRRASSYDKIVAPFDPAPDGRPDVEAEPETNLCDYWDGVERQVSDAFVSWRTGRPPPLRRFSVFVTERCNLKCSYCSCSPTTGRTMDLGRLADLLGAAHAHGAVFFDVLGLGEPTLLDKLPELLGKASSRGMISTVGTNGATPNLLNRGYRERLFLASPLKLRLSLDSADPEVHDGVRGGRPSWRQAVRFIQHAVEARERGELTAGIFVNRVLTTSNEADLERDIKFFASLGVDDVHLIPVRFLAEEFFSVGRIRRFNRDTAPMLKELGRALKFPWLRRNAYPFGWRGPELELAAQGRYFVPTMASDCHVLKTQLTLDCEGRVYTCMWGKRAGGSPILDAGSDRLSLEEILERREGINYLDANSEICAKYCTRHIAEANDRLARVMNEPGVRQRCEAAHGVA